MTITSLPFRFESGRGLRLDLGRPVYMGILNITPDSFSDGGRYTNTDAVVQQAHKLVSDGAMILDVGGESSRPGSDPVSANDEANRVLPVIKALRDTLPDVAISIDTTKASVAAQAAALGAEFINDISALSDPEMASVASQYQTGLILMHMRGTPKTMQSDPIHYSDVTAEVISHLNQAIEKAQRSGVAKERIWVDPGIGFGKNLEHNLALTRDVGDLRQTGCHVLYGPSRKRFLGDITGRDVGDRDRATAAACSIAAYEGANIFRVHDVAAVRDAIEVGYALRTNDS